MSACNEPRVTTAASAITTGSMLACGMEPCRRARRTTHRLVLGGGRSSNNGIRTGDCATTLFTGYRCESEGWKRIGPVAIFFAGRPSGHHSIRVFETLFRGAGDGERLPLSTESSGASRHAVSGLMHLTEGFSRATLATAASRRRPARLISSARNIDE